MPNARVYWLHTLTATHPGVGRGLGYIDLPIDRDAVTGWPLVRGSAFKGVWADHFQATEEGRREDSLDGRRRRAAFGVSSDAKDNDSNSGSLIPTDARLVCLPVRSFRGTFAWCTSPLVLRMLHRVLTLAGATTLPEVPAGPADDKVLLPEGSEAGGTSVLVEKGRVYLEDLDFEAIDHADCSQWASRIAQGVFPADTAWQAELAKRFAVLPDIAFDFLCETGTEVHTRVRIKDDTKTVAQGALWTEESLPAETILAGLIACDRIFGKDGRDITRDDLLQQFASRPLNLQIGGKATVGRGQVRCLFGEGGSL